MHEQWSGPIFSYSKVIFEGRHSGAPGDLLFDRKQLKMTWKLHFWWLFYWGEHLHTHKGSDLYFHILNKNWREGHAGPSSGGYPSKKYIEKNWVMWHIIWKLLENSIQICQLNVHLTPYLTVSSRKLPKNLLFLLIVLLRGACPHWLS